MSTPFPRGKTADNNASAASSNSHQEKNLFGNNVTSSTSSSTSTKKRTVIEDATKLKLKRKKESEDALAISLSEAGLGMTSIVNSKQIKIDQLSFTKYPAGTLVFGYVLQILKNGSAVISLPGGVTGVLGVEQISDISFLMMRDNNRSLVRIIHLFIYIFNVYF